MQVNGTKLYLEHKVNIIHCSPITTLWISPTCSLQATPMSVSQKMIDLSEPADPQYNEGNSVKTRTRCIAVNIYACINTYIFYDIIYTFIIWLNKHFFSIILNDASEHIWLILALRILFQMIGPWYLFVKFDTQKGMCNCWALLVLCSWIV